MLQRTHLKALISLMTAPVLVAMGCQTTPAYDGDRALDASDDESMAFPSERTAVLMVKGLACPYCVQNVDRQLVGLAGVDRVHVDLPTGKVRVLLSDDDPATHDALVSAVDDSGFTLDDIEMPR